METQDLHDKMERLIAEGREDEALEEVLKVADFQPRDLRALIMVTSNKYQKLRHNLMIGKISRENAAVVSAEITSNLLEIVDQVNWEQVAPEVLLARKEEAEKSKKRKVIFTIVSLLSLLLIVVLSTVFDAFSNRPNAPDNQLSYWAGATWQQEMESTGATPIRGSLNFELTEEGQIRATAQNRYPNGTEYACQLFAITSMENGRVLAGQWKVPAVRSYFGTFRFTLKDKKAFTGHYTLNGQDGQFFWNGQR